MERRNHARVAVNLKAALLDDQAMPLGCRVRDVSKGGMLLQHDHYDKATTFHEGDEVEVANGLLRGLDGALDGALEGFLRLRLQLFQPLLAAS